MQDSLILTTLAFQFPEESKIFYFSETDSEDCRLTKLYHTLFPNNIREIVPEIDNNTTSYSIMATEDGASYKDENAKGEITLDNSGKAISGKG